MHKQIAEFLNKNVQGANAEVKESEVGDSSVYVSPSHLLASCKALKQDAQFQFDVLQVVTGCDYPEDKCIEVSYIIANFVPKDHELILKVKLPRDNPMVESVCSVWKSANFQERECHDMLGVTFQNHPDLRRILCPEDWQGYPLLKDYVVQEVYRDMVVNPVDKMNVDDREFAAKQKALEKEQKKNLNQEN